MRELSGKDSTGLENAYSQYEAQLRWDKERLEKEGGTAQVYPN
jgi:hypothetical protein